MTLTLDFQGQIKKNWLVIHDHDLLKTKVRCKDVPYGDQGNFWDLIQYKDVVLPV